MRNWDTFKIIIADLDGTLSKSKSFMDAEMSELISQLLNYKFFAVISGGSYEQFQDQFLVSLSKSGNLDRLFLLPTCGTSMYILKNGKWTKVYGEKLSEDAKEKIFYAFENALRDAGFVKPKVLYGELIEDRETQITFSAYGQKAPLELKREWDPDCKKRAEIVRRLTKYLPSNLQAKIGGTTSIDVTEFGIDKAYGIKKIEEKLGFKKQEMLFIGDRLEEGGNDYPVKAVGVECIKVNDPEDSKRIIREIISSSKLSVS